MRFIYPGNLKEKKTILFLSVGDLLVTGVFVVLAFMYAARNFSYIPLIYPAVFVIMKLRMLEDGSNIWEKLMDAFNYLVNSQQLYFWNKGRRK